MKLGVTEIVVVRGISLRLQRVKSTGQHSEYLGHPTLSRYYCPFIYYFYIY